MGARQREIGASVVEVGRAPPGALPVAAGALLPGELPAVRAVARVAAGAGLGEAGKPGLAPALGAVATGARRARVRARQREAGPGVLEASGGVPRAAGVARGAVLRDRGGVRVFVAVAARAVVRKAEERLVQPARFAPAHLRVSDGLWRVARAARRAGVLADEGEAREAVAEAGLVEPRDVGAAALVVAVAVGAVPRDVGVEPAARPNAPRQRLVAREALGGLDAALAELRGTACSFGCPSRSAWTLGSACRAR